MKDYYETNKRKKTAYLYYGLITAALTGLTLVSGVLSAIRGEGLPIVLTSFGAAIFWGAAAFISFYVFYNANRSSIASDNINNE